MFIYIKIVQENTSMYTTTYAMETGIETEPPMRMQAELVISERNADNSSKKGPEDQHTTKVPMHCRLVSPNVWNFLYTNNINLSTAISIAVTFDTDIEVMKMTPDMLHNTECFHCRAMYRISPSYIWWDTIVTNKYTSNRPSAILKLIINSGKQLVFLLYSAIFQAKLVEFSSILTKA